MPGVEPGGTVLPHLFLFSHVSTVSFFLFVCHLFLVVEFLSASVPLVYFDHAFLVATARVVADELQ